MVKWNSLRSCVDFEKMILCLDYPKGENMTLEKDGGRIKVIVAQLFYYFTTILFTFLLYIFQKASFCLVK